MSSPVDGAEQGSPGFRVARPSGVAEVLAAGELFDAQPDPDATAAFLAAPNHHLLFAVQDDGRAVGFVSGVETIHPDKGTEMLLYELAVDEPARGRGVATALVVALAELARDRGCYGMWVLTDLDNPAAHATYRKAGGTPESRTLMFSWDFTDEQAGDR